LLLLGALFAVITLSVVIQVDSFKLTSKGDCLVTGKRPDHHEPVGPATRFH
jgi:hypothetical protein